MTPPVTPGTPPAAGPPIRFDLGNVALATAVVLAVVELGRFVREIESVIILLVFSLILATAIDPIVNALRRRGFQQRYGVLLIYLVLVLIVSVFVFFIAQILITEFVALVTALPATLRRLNAQAGALPPGVLRETAIAAVVGLQSALGSSATTTVANSGALSGLVAATLSVFETVFAAVTILVIAYFWIFERASVRRWIVGFVPARRRETVIVLWETIEDRLGAWSRGQILLMIVVAAIQGTGYALLGLPFAPLLAAWAGLAELIPMIGPYLGAAPALLVALAESPQKALLVAGFALVVNLIEANVLVPRIMERALGLSPLTVIIALLAGIEVGGVVGAILAVPIAAAMQAGLEELAYLHSLEG
jgi:predicted PurR-regulated permease PerM